MAIVGVKLRYENWFYHVWHLANGHDKTKDCLVCGIKSKWLDKDKRRQRDKNRRATQRAARQGA